jgi:hypothetical protein
MKLLDLLKEEGEKKGLVIAEVAIVKVYEVLEAVAPRLVVEGEGAEKIIGSVLATALPVFKSAVEKLADLNKDGKIG